MPKDITDMMWDALQADIASVKTDVRNLQTRTERAEVSDSIPAYAYVSLPTAANGGLGTGTTYITLAWVTDGRKPGEGAGTGTGILAYWDNAAGVWKRLSDYTAVTV